MDNAEFWLRLAGFVPLAFIAYFKVRLWLIIPSPAWGLLALGFTLIAVSSGIVLVWNPANVLMVILSMRQAGLVIAAVGVWLQWRDLRRFLRRRLD